MRRLPPNRERVKATVEQTAASGESAWYVYVVRCRDATLYTGIAKNLPARIAAHNAGEGAKYTRGRGPVVLVHTERVMGRASAQRREAEIKRLSAPCKRRLVTVHQD